MDSTIRVGQGAMGQGYLDIEGFGFLFEQIIIFATGLDIAACLTGRTYARGAADLKI